MPGGWRHPDDIQLRSKGMERIVEISQHGETISMLQHVCRLKACAWTYPMQNKRVKDDIPPVSKRQS